MSRSKLPWLCFALLGAACARASEGETRVAAAPAMTSPPPLGATATATTAPPSRTAANEHDARAEQPPPCPEFNDQVIHEAGPPKKQYGVDGYLGRTLHLSREGEPDEHCLVVAWPAGKQNSDGKRVDVARHIDEAWFRLIENTLARIPWSHAKTLRRIVIDDHPLLHGLGAFDRGDPEDGRDGHTIWLNEHLFTDGDHWVRANVGSYFSYHTNRPNAVIDAEPSDHDLFSPVLLHEIGHIVMYNLVNPEGEEDRTPPCARTCGDEDKGCKALSKAEQERNCISPYCRPHGYPGSTENWAEQYRFYYQSSHTRALLLEAGSLCLGVLAGLDEWPPEAEGWPFALPDPQEFRPSRWDSCGGHACKRW